MICTRFTLIFKNPTMSLCYKYEHVICIFKIRGLGCLSKKPAINYQLLSLVSFHCLAFTGLSEREMTWRSVENTRKSHVLFFCENMGGPSVLCIHPVSLHFHLSREERCHCYCLQTRLVPCAGSFHWIFWRENSHLLSTNFLNAIDKLNRCVSEKSIVTVVISLGNGTLKDSHDEEDRGTFINFQCHSQIRSKCHCLQRPVLNHPNPKPGLFRWSNQAERWVLPGFEL